MMINGNPEPFAVTNRYDLVTCQWKIYGVYNFLGCLSISLITKYLSIFTRTVWNINIHGIGPDLMEDLFFQASRFGSEIWRIDCLKLVFSLFLHSYVLCFIYRCNCELKGFESQTVRSTDCEWYCVHQGGDNLNWRRGLVAACTRGGALPRQGHLHLCHLRRVSIQE